MRWKCGRCESVKGGHSAPRPWPIKTGTYAGVWEVNKVWAECGRCDQSKATGIWCDKSTACCPISNFTPPFFTID